MSNYYGINRSDEYLQHWGIPKGGQRKNHKYLMRVKSGSGWRYLYTPAEVAAYGKERVSGAITKAGRMAKSLGKRIGGQATYGVQRVTGLFRKEDPMLNTAKKPLRGSDATERIQSHLKKSRPEGLSIARYPTGHEKYVTPNGRPVNSSYPHSSQGVTNASKGDYTATGRARDQRKKADSSSGKKSYSNGASGKNNSRRVQKKLSSQRGNTSTYYNPTHTKVKVKKKAFADVPVLRSIPIVRDIPGRGTETIEQQLYKGRRPIKNKTTRSKANKQERYYK
jgi:hypothetical protein